MTSGSRQCPDRYQAGISAFGWLAGRAFVTVVVVRGVPWWGLISSAVALA